MLAASLLATLLAPALVSAGMFPADSLIKPLTAKQFPKAMKENTTSVVAYYAPWCGHCQRMAPELSKAALGLYPLVPVYAVDCDDAKNKQLCAREGVQGFPTIKMYPRGKTAPAKTFDGPERTASAFWYWVTRRVPHKSKKLYKLDQIEPWVSEHKDEDAVLLLTKDKNVPLLWQVLANKYRDDFSFASHRDAKGKSAVALGYEAGGKKESKVLVYAKGSTKPFRFEGVLKLDSLSKFLDSILDGSADLSSANEEAKADSEHFELSAEEEEIQERQEAQRIALAHGGFSDLIDFEEAIKKYGKDFHGSNGYAGVMGDMPKKKKEGEAGAKGTEEKKAKKEDPIHQILKAQKEQQEKEANKPATPKTGDAGQVVFEAKTGAAAATATAKPAAAASAESAEPVVPEPESEAPTIAEANAEPAAPRPQSEHHDEL